MAQRYAGKQLGDRPDGRKLRTIPSGERLLPMLVRTRSAAQERYHESVEISAALVWLDEKEREGLEGIGMTHLVAAAFVRTAARLPYINRFVAGHRIYARDELDVLLAGLGESYSSEVKVRLNANDTVEDVYHKTVNAIDELRAENREASAERVTDFLLLLPRFLLRFGVQLLRLLDYFGLLSRRLLFTSPWHASLRLYDNAPAGLGSNALPLYNLGSTSVCLTLGAVRRTLEPDENGKLIPRRWLDLDMTVDSRIATKAEIEKALLYWKHYLAAPHELETAPKRVMNDEN